MVKLDDVFPGLATGGFRITSPANRDYNCVAWASGDTSSWWWPGPDLKHEFWPSNAPREPTLAAFQAAFASIGYIVCASEELEPGFEKIALFADDQGLPKHVARQRASGLWTSKLGKLEDIEHQLHDLEGIVYGSVALVMKRALPP